MTAMLEDSVLEIADLVGRKYVAVLKRVVSRSYSLEASPHRARMEVIAAVALELGAVINDELTELSEVNAYGTYDEHEIREQTMRRRIEKAKSMIERLIREHFYRDLGLMLYRGGTDGLVERHASEPIAAA
ncbi:MULTISPECIES: hypothetical protein [unclassified Pannonibacter]|uniref:hypothetical protein n=1 Tax=unclassified Pannonibacter TaxID=2627228 RepID=UPI001645FBC8|nr:MULTISPECIES: hypothetical protein [unclassified Pannonibacter]